MHVIDSLAVGGAERMLVEIANASATHGHCVSVCVTRDGRDLAPELRQLDLTIQHGRCHFLLQPAEWNLAE
jgi:hypothetical protein